MDISLKTEIPQYDQDLQKNQERPHNIKQLISIDIGYQTTFKTECLAILENRMNQIARFIAICDNFYFPKF